MSSADDIIVAEARMMCCASCGKSELDDIKLMDCDGCKSVRYCSDACKEDHQSLHETKCKEYQAAYQAVELRDEILFRQPESTHRGDCPLCCVPMPIEDLKTSSLSCCSKLICKGCGVAEMARQRRENVRVVKCPFCRHPIFKSSVETHRKLMKRAAVNDPKALRLVGLKHFEKGEYGVAFEYLTKAAEWGDADAHFNLSIMYKKGLGVQTDEKKEIYHLEEAAIAGHPPARLNLGVYEWNNGRFDRAVKHHTIGANLGLDRSIQELKECYKKEYVSKEDFAAALRAYHAAAKAMKSPQREAAERATFHPHA